MKLFRNSKAQAALIVVQLQFTRSYNIVLDENLPDGCTVSECDAIIATELTADFDPLHPNSDELFEAATDFEWMRSANESHLEYPFMLCDLKPDISGSQRKVSLNAYFETIDMKNVMTPVYNAIKSKTCWYVSLTKKNGKKLLASFSQENSSEILTLQPLVPSLKMEFGLINSVEQETIDSQYDDNFFDDETNLHSADAIEIAVIICDTSDISEANGTDVGNSILEYITVHHDKVLESSFFYQEYQKYKGLSDNITSSNLTERIQFWGDCLDKSFYNDTNSSCTDKIKETVSFEENIWSREQGTYRLSFSIEPGELPSHCMWSAIQGIAMNPHVCNVEYIPQYRFWQPETKSEVSQAHPLISLLIIVVFAMILL